MSTAGQEGIYCTRHHRYDLSKNGYINLLNQSTATRYDKTLFDARRRIMTAGFFEPLIQWLASHLSTLVVQHGGSRNLRLLDAGCGEGSLLHLLGKQLLPSLPSTIMRDPVNFTGAGIDVAKEGIKLASQGNEALGWFVADLARIPFTDGLFDCVLNVLAPAHYSEFRRVLRSGGVLIKVIPGNLYLAELRHFLHDEMKHNSNHSVYRYERTLKRFQEKFDSQLQEERIRYTFSLNDSTRADLLNMTPLIWNEKEALLKNRELADLSEVTVDLVVLLGSAM